MPQVTPLKIAIVTSGLSGRELAERIGCDERQISRWANGRHLPLRVYRQALADQLGTTPEALFPTADSEAVA